MSDHDVYSFGVVASSTHLGLGGPFPAPEGYAEIISVNQTIGGEAANSSLVLSRLGAKVMLDGNWIGADDAGRHVKSWSRRKARARSSAPIAASRRTKPGTCP